MRNDVGKVINLIN